jgi:hypothetical protein
MHGEDMLTLPEGWRPLPWRADPDVPVPGAAAPDPRAPALLAALYAERPELREQMLRHPDSDRALADSDPDGPLAAALTVLAHTEAIVHCDWEYARARRERVETLLADAWLAGHGLAFAAEAAVILMELDTAGDRRGGDRAPTGVRWRYSSSGHLGRDYDIARTVLYRARDVLAAAPPADYATVVTALARVRDARDSVHRRVCVAVLAPGERAWVAAAVDELAAAHPSWHNNGNFATLLLAGSDPEQARRLAPKADLGAFRDPGSRVLATLATVAGEAAVEVLRGASDPLCLEALSLLPFDSAFIDLRNRAADRDVRPWLLAAAARFPARASRLLAEAGGRRILGDLLRWTVVAHPAAAAEALPSLTGPAAARLAAILDEIAARADAEPDAVPAFPAAPRKKPAVHEWMLTGVLPPLLRDGAALPAAEVPALLTAFGLSRVGAPWEHLAAVTAAFDPEDLARYVWDVFFRWYYLGGTPKESWLLDALALAGDDGTIRRLTPTILAWPGETGHARAVAGLGVLAAIGTEEALMALDRVSQRAAFKGLKTAARQRMDDVAARLGLTGEQLADRLVPDLGLDARGRTVIDYGPRSFTVVLDDRLTPHVTDATGRRLKALPKPGAHDDADRAPAEQKRFAELKKEARSLGVDLTARLERDMIHSRRVTGEEFLRHFVAHPLTGLLARRLVWGVHDDTGRLISAVRVVEDGTLADVHDDAVTLPAGARVGVAHPLHLGAALPAFGELFTDYEIVQPFPQLGRQVYRLTPVEADGATLSRFDGRRASAGALIGLEKRGWLRDAPESGDSSFAITRALPGGGRVYVGISGLSLSEPEDQQLRAVSLWSPPARFGDLDPVLASEIIGDLTGTLIS